MCHYMELCPLFSNRKLEVSSPLRWVKCQNKKLLKAVIHTTAPISLSLLCLTISGCFISLPVSLVLSLISFHTSTELSNNCSPGQQAQTLNTEPLLWCQWQSWESSLKGVTNTMRLQDRTGWGTHLFTYILYIRKKINPHRGRNRYNYCRIKRNRIATTCNFLSFFGKVKSKKENEEKKIYRGGELIHFSYPFV